MDSTRTRISAVLEWVVALICLFGVLELASIAVSHGRHVPAVTPVSAQASPPVVAPAGIPSRAVSVPMLVLSDGTRLDVGERASELADKVKAAWHVGVDSVERGGHGDRITRAYNDGVKAFLLVLEPFAQDADVHISAIYLP